jgi:hypothetical protein
VQLRPYLVTIPLQLGTGTLASFFVHNIGNGAALNIRISRGPTGSISIPFLPRAERVQVLTKSATGQARTQAVSGDHPYGRYELMLDDESARQEISLAVEFADVVGHPHRMTVHIGPSDARVEG